MQLCFVFFQVSCKCVIRLAKFKKKTKKKEENKNQKKKRMNTQDANKCANLILKRI